MRSKQGLVALTTCLAMATGGLTAEAAPAQTKAPTRHTKKTTKKHAKRCKILLVNGVHRCKGEHARRTSASSTRPVVNVTINNITPQTQAATPATVVPAATGRQAVLNAILAAIPGASKHDADRLRDVAKKLTDSIASGKLDKQKDVVHKLLELQGDKNATIPAATVQGWIAGLTA